MPGDSLNIRYHDSTYVISAYDNLPVELDTVSFVKQVFTEYQNKAKETESTPEIGIPLTVFTIFILIMVVSRMYDRYNPQQIEPTVFPTPYSKNNYQVFSGTKLHVTPELLHTVLSKYFIYYRELIAEEQERFVKRLQVFLKEKTFTVPADEGYCEMPILVSASAVQLTFGLKDYKLPWYEYIHVHPAEYILVNPLRTLAGNVSGKTITVSWKHFFADYQKKDGVNLGLHEMAHALQMQHEYFYKRKGADFRKVYNLFESLDEHILKTKNSSGNHLYTGYALTNTDEFWACSVELFFEQPELLKLCHADIYAIIKTLLKQDPAASTSQPCVLAES